MPIHERDRIRFHGWLVQHDLDEEVADAILATMPPYDWHELATKADLAVMEQRTTDQFTMVEARFTGMDRRLDSLDKQLGLSFDQLDRRMAGMALEIRAIMFTLIGLIVSVLLAGSAALFG